MKLLFLTITCFLLTTVHAQKKEAYYDFQWKPCEPEKSRYYSVAVKKDGLWYHNDYFIQQKSLQMTGTFKDEEGEVRDGVFKYFYANGNLQSAGNYINNKKNGVWISYYSDGMMSDSVTYENGMVIGTRLSWHRNGYIKDSAVWQLNGNGVEVSWYDNGNPSSAGLYHGGKPHGKWQFFHKNGKPASIETYGYGLLISKEYFNEAGDPMKETNITDHEESFPGGVKAWRNYVDKRAFFPQGWKIVNTNAVTVVVQGDIEEDGSVSHVEVILPFHKDFDARALEILTKSPKWIPAQAHNRKIKSSITLPITFIEGED